jgi:hypothetical protein
MNQTQTSINIAGLTEVPVIVAKGYTDAQKQEFIVKDNVSFGEWDWDAIANEWDMELLNEWGMTIPKIEEFSGGLSGRMGLEINIPNNLELNKIRYRFATEIK